MTTERTHTVAAGDPSADRIRARLSGAAAHTATENHGEAVAQARAILEKTTALHEAALAEVHRIAEAMRADAPSVDAARAAVDAARTRLQDVSAAQALGEVDQSAVQAAAAEVKRCEKDLAQAEAATLSMATLSEGLARRLAVAQAAEVEAHAAKHRAENGLIRAALVEADAAYTKAAEALATHAGRVLGFAAMLAHRDKSLIPAATSCAIGMPNLPTIGPVSAEAVATHTNGREHGVRAVLIEGHRMRAEPTALEAELMLGLNTRGA